MTPDINTLVQTAFTKLVEEGELQKLVDTRIKDLVKSALEQATNWKSPFQEGLNQYVTESLRMDFSKLGLGAYHATIIEIIKSKLDASLMTWVDKTIAESMGELLTPPPESIKLSEFVIQMHGYMKRTHRGEGEIEFEIEESDTNGYWALNAKFGSYKLNKYRIAVSRTGEIYHISIPYEGDITKRLFVSTRNEPFEKSLWQFYAAKTKLIRDVDSIHDIELPDDEEGED